MEIPGTCGLAMIGITMRFAQSMSGCRLGGYMSREFVSMSSCVGRASRHGHDQTSNGILKDKRWAKKPPDLGGKQERG